MTIRKQLQKVRQSLALQQRTLATLESMEMCDAGKTIELTKQIITNLECRKTYLERQAQ